VNKKILTEVLNDLEYGRQPVVTGMSFNRDEIDEMKKAIQKHHERMISYFNNIICIREIK
jgi:hypothetical protein